MSIKKTYNPKELEQKWYNHWIEKGYFHSKPDKREPYTIVIPPPNVTGILHMGHILNNTLQDVLIRRARMKGYNTCWVPGTDHASIATEAKVVKRLSDKGIQKKDLSREDFMKHAFNWKDEHGSVILDQLKRLGASCDWERTKFTMDDDMSESVIKVFVNLYNKGLIYRGVRMVTSSDGVMISANNPEQEEGEEFFNANYEGEVLDIAFNVNYFQEILSTLDTNECEIHFFGADKSCLITPPDSQNLKYIVMPLLI